MSGGMRRLWCDLCRGSADRDGDLFKCTTCPRRFHRECIKGGVPKDGAFTCPMCAGGAETEDDKANAKSAKDSMKRVRAAHAQLRTRSSKFYKMEKKRLAPFVPRERIKKLMEVKPQSGSGGMGLVHCQTVFGRYTLHVVSRWEKDCWLRNLGSQFHSDSYLQVVSISDTARAVSNCNQVLVLPNHRCMQHCLILVLLYGRCMHRCLISTRVCACV